jgi:hypothetical protein
MNKLLIECIDALVEEAIDIERVMTRATSPSATGKLALMEFKGRGQKSYVLYNGLELLKVLQVANNYAQLVDLVNDGMNNIIVGAGQTVQTSVLIDEQQVAVKELKFMAARPGRGPLMLAIIMKDAGALIPDRETVFPDMKRLIATYWNSVKNDKEAWKPLDRGIFNTKQVRLHGFLPWKGNPLDNVYYAKGPMMNVPLGTLRNAHVDTMSKAEMVYKGPEEPKSSAMKMALQDTMLKYINEKVS